MSEVEGSGFMVMGVEEFKVFLLKTGHFSVVGSFKKRHLLFRGAKLVYNPSGRDGYCLLQCLAASSLLEKDPQVKKLECKRNTFQKSKKLVRVPDEEFPLAWDDIGLIELENNVSIYVYDISRISQDDDDDEVWRRKPGKEQHEIYVARKGNPSGKCIPLLLLDGNHFVLIK